MDRQLMRLLAAWLLLCVQAMAAAPAIPPGAPVSQSLVSGLPAPANSIGATRVGPCDIFAAAGTPCVAAHSVTRALYGAYKGSLFTLKRQSDSTTAQIGMISTGLYDAGAVAAFCAGTSCVVTQITDQTGNANHLPSILSGFAANATPGNPAPWTFYYRNGLPVVWTAGNKSAYRNRTSTTNIPTGASASSTYAVLATDVYSNCCGGYGRMENPVGSACSASNPAVPTCPWGSMWALGFMSYSRPTSATAVTALGLGVDHEGNTTAYKMASIPLVSSLLSKLTASGTMSTRYGDATGGLLSTITAGAPPITPVVQNGISLGEGGDASTAPLEFFEGAVTTGATSDATDAAVQANIVAFYGAQTAPVLGPVDALTQQGFTTGGSGLDISPVVNGAWALRRLRLSYTGYAALLVRASDATTLDVGFGPSGDFDDTTAAIFCAGTTCYVQRLHNQALLSSGNYTGPTSNDLNIQASGQAMTALPQLVLNGLNGRTYMHFGGSYLCTPGSFTGVSNNWSSMAVARRTGNTTAQNNVLDSLNESQTMLGFAAAANTALFVSAAAGGGNITASAPDSAWHSLVASNAAGAISLTVDGGTPVTGSITSTNFTGYACMGGDLNKHQLTGDVAEAYLANVALTSAQIATLYSNQRAYYGDQF